MATKNVLLVLSIAIIGITIAGLVVMMSAPLADDAEDSAATKTAIVPRAAKLTRDEGRIQVPTEMREVVPTNANSSDTEIDDAFAWCDAQVRKDFTPPIWFYTRRNIDAELATIDPLAAVTEIACAETVCRVGIRHASAAAREEFSRHGMAGISLSGTTFFKYPKDDPRKTIAYLMKTGSHEEVAASLR